MIDQNSGHRALVQDRCSARLSPPLKGLWNTSRLLSVDGTLTEACWSEQMLLMTTLPGGSASRLHAYQRWMTLTSSVCVVPPLKPPDVFHHVVFRLLSAEGS